MDLTAGLDVGHPTKKALPVMGVESRATLTHPTIYLNRTSCKCVRVFSLTRTFIHTNNYTHINSPHKHSMHIDNITTCFTAPNLMPQNTVSVRSWHELDRLTGTNNTAAVTDSTTTD